MTIKLFLLAVLFVLSGGAAFSEYFKGHKFISLLAMTIAIIATFYLFQDIYDDLKQPSSSTQVELQRQAEAQRIAKLEAKLKRQNELQQQALLQLAELKKQQADSEQNVLENTQLDVVFLIDQSGSIKAIDKYKHRISIVENVIMRLAEHAKGTPLIHRVSVVEFGGDSLVPVAVPISVLELKYNPVKPNDIVSKTKRHIANALHSRSENMGNTDIPLGMKVALAEFRQLKAKSGGEIRERKLLLFIGGRPYTYKKQLEHLRRDIENYADELERSNVSLWVIGLNNASDYWNTGDGAFWKNVVGMKQTRFAETSFPNIASIVQNLVDQWLGMGDY